MDWCPRLSLVDSLWSGLTGPFVTKHTHTHSLSCRGLQLLCVGMAFWWCATVPQYLLISDFLASCASVPRSCVCAPCNPFLFFLIQRENGLHGVCATELGGSSVRGVCGVAKGWGDRSGCVWAGWIKPGLGTWVMGEHMVMMSTWGG
jgi:hypothetical protein